MSFLDILEHFPLFWASLIAQLVKNCLQCRRPWFDSWVAKIPWRRARLPTPVFLGFPGSSDSKEYACNVGDLGSISGLGRSPRGRRGNPLHYSCLENPHGLESQAWLSDWTQHSTKTGRDQSSLCFTPSCEDPARRWSSTSQKHSLLQIPNLMVPWSWTLQLPEL